MRNNYSKEEIAAIYNTPLLELIYQAATVHRNQDTAEVQVCTLLSIKPQALLSMTKTFSAVKKTQPAFVYAHLYLPHDPF